MLNATTLPLPNPPVNVVATATSPTKITLTWQEQIPQNGLLIANYQVYRGTTPGYLTKVATVTSTTYNNSNLTPSTRYYFEVIAVDKSYDDSIPSDQISGMTMPLPPAATIVSGTSAAATKLVLTWTDAPAPGGLAITRYNVNCGTTPANMPKVATTTNTTYNYLNLRASTTYYCNVVANDSSNALSQPSNTISATTAPMPNAPDNVVAIANKSTKVTVTWTETLPPNGVPISSYKVYRSTSLPVTTANFVATRTTPSYIDTTVTTQRTYYYAITATDSGQDVSQLSDPAAVTTP